jgi:hypothetical protein
MTAAQPAPPARGRATSGDAPEKGDSGCSVRHPWRPLRLLAELYRIEGRHGYREEWKL